MGAYRAFGGVHCETAALRNTLEHQGIMNSRAGRPFTEAEVFGIAGGIGAGYSFCPSVVRNGNGSGITIVGRHLAYSFDASYHAQFLDGLGIEPTIVEASSARAGTKKLVAALEETKRPVIVQCARALPWHSDVGACASDSGVGYSVVVYGVDGDDALVSDLAKVGLRVPLDVLGAARDQICTHKNRLISYAPPKRLTATRVKQAMVDGVAACAEAMLHPRIKTFSLEGWVNWSKLITNEKNKAGWPVVFKDRPMVWPLRSVFETVQVAGTGGGLMRGLFAELLDAASAATRKKAFAASAEEYRGLAKKWTSLARGMLPDRVPELKETKHLIEARHKALARRGERGIDEIHAASRRLDELARAELPLSDRELRDLLEKARGRIVDLHAAETEAITRLGAVVGVT